MSLDFFTVNEKTAPVTEPHIKTYGVFLFFLLFGSGVLFAQNKTENTYNAQSIDNIVIDGYQIFNIGVSTADTDIIKIESTTDGEYQNNFKIVSKTVKDGLYIALGRAGIDNIPDDKRNAHKVVAAELKVQIPANKSISVKSDVGSVSLNGSFEFISIDLGQGDFKATGIAKGARIKTVGGNIFIETKNAKVDTDSHRGKVDVPKGLLGYGIWKLKTNSGNITIRKIE